jgi:hypothetical protein
MVVSGNFLKHRVPPPIHTYGLFLSFHFLHREERRVKTQANWWVIVLIMSLGFTACQGSGQTINFDPHASPSSMKAEAYHDDNLTIVVEPFRDTRPNTHRIGSRTHFWGGATHFNVWNGNLSEGMAKLAVEYLQQRGWQASRASTTEPSTAESPGDVRLTGDILSFDANAKTGFGFTDIAVQIRVAFEAKNAIDGSTVRMVLGANGTDTVATFDQKDMEQLTNLVMKDLFNQLFQDLTVKNKAFHLKSEKS